MVIRKMSRAGYKKLVNTGPGSNCTAVIIAPACISSRVNCDRPLISSRKEIVASSNVSPGIIHLDISSAWLCGGSRNVMNIQTGNRTARTPIPAPRVVAFV
jgi:hypothetical protein